MAERSLKEIIQYAYSDEHQSRIAPVQGYPPGIPWPIHLEAYEAYCRKYGGQVALIDLDGRRCRGGFGINELDVLIPNWRHRVTYIGKLRERNLAYHGMLAMIRDQSNTDPEIKQMIVELIGANDDRCNPQI